MRNIKGGERFSGLFNKLVAMNEEDRTLTANERFFNHPTGHDSFAGTAGRDTDNAFVILNEFVAHGVDKVALIRS